MPSQPHYRQVVEADIQRAMQSLLKPGKGYVGCKEVLETLVTPDARIGELSSLPLGRLGQRLMALRYFIANGATWLRFFDWEPALARVATNGPDTIRALTARIESTRRVLSDAEALARELDAQTLVELGNTLEDAPRLGDGSLVMVRGK